MNRLPSWIRQHLAALRAVAVLTVILGVVYPLVTTGVAQALFDERPELIGQSFTDAEGDPVAKYFQSRPSASGYDMLATAASNLGPEDVVDAPDKPSLLTQVCARSAAVGRLEGVSGARPYCTPDGVGAVLKVFPDRAVSVNQACPAQPFVATYQGVKVECGKPGEDYAAGRTVPVRGDARAVVPADAVTASGSALDPHISVAYAELQAPRVARERGLPVDRVTSLIRRYTTGRPLGFMGEPGVNVLELNRALDKG
ncbi:potassium-transporting ATPase subunit C [Herbidospora cretacea]|uniref:potassium-transporting ATPase subunit C n=1 Tax=Herbidospora cretacea TaxID=28444 RepID=UPI0004C3BC12|nr:potassium-transporting ATPase subunit C [Herbidospora cretacea]